MSNRYHINPETGRAGVCSAKIKCKFNLSEDQHYATKEEARKAFEVMKSSETLPKAAKKEAAPKEEEQVHYYDAKIHTVLWDNKDKAIAAIDKANRRLERAGIENRFTYEVEDFEKEYQVNGYRYVKKYSKFTLNEPKISLEGYEFQAAMHKEEAGFVTRAAPGVDLQGMRPDAMVCDHCGHNRPRAKTYLIKGPDGEIKQIGSSCVANYLGVKPEGLWAMGFDPLEDEEGDAKWMNHAAGGTSFTNVDQSLAVALVVSENGERFVGSGNWDMPGGSTADQVSAAIWSNNPKDAAWRIEVNSKANALIKSGEVERLKKTIQELSGNGDYATNLKVVASSEYVHPRNNNLLISAVSILGRQKREAQYAKEKADREAKRSMEWATGHTWKKGDKLPKGTKFEVVENHNTWSTNYYGNETPTSRLVMKDENGRQITWFASSRVRAPKGSSLEVSSGTVKNTGQYKEVDQTIVSRLRVSNIDIPEGVEIDEDDDY